MSETKHYGNGVTGRLELDGDAESPLSWNDSVILVVLHRRYTNPGKDTANDPDSLAEFETENAGVYHAFPVYMFDHGNTVYQIGTSGNPFSCRFDSGRVGSILLAKSDWQDEADAEKAAIATLETYTQWANGECYGYIIEDADGEELDSCWGFIGRDCALESMDEAAASHVTTQGDKQATAAAEEITLARPDFYPS